MRLVIKVDQDRVEDMITVNEYLGIQQGHLPSVISMVSKCMWNEDTNTFYDVDEAKRLIGKLSLKQLKELATTVDKELFDQAVPPVLEDGSGQA